MGLAAINRLIHREDFQRRPVRALSRRVIWRLRWLSMDRPWHLQLPNGLSVFAPHCGAGALIYYQGCSEPETARFLQRFLQPGMVFFDIGAHIGEYALLASTHVGPSGSVHAFEPQPDTFEILRENIQYNHLTNVTVRCSAIAESEGSADFAVRAEPSLSSILPHRPATEPKALKTIIVPKCHLDGYCAATGCWPHLVKVDVEGAEVNVLQGAETLLSKPPAAAPVWILEYSPETYRRFGYSHADTITVLRRHGYVVHALEKNGNAIPIRDGQHRWDHSQNLVATKQPLLLSEALNRV